MIISHKNGRGSKIHIFIDEEYQITTNADFWAENFIPDGSEIDEDEWVQLVEKINYSKAVKKCYDLLAVRSHSVKELRDKLRRSYEDDICDKAIDLMLEYKYLDDEEYANELFNHLKDNKMLSKNHIVLEMKKRGISREIYSGIIENADIDNVSTAYEIISSKYMQKLGAEGGEQKVIAALARKGFSYSDIKSAIERIKEDYEF